MSCWVFRVWKRGKMDRVRGLAVFIHREAMFEDCVLTSETEHIETWKYWIVKFRGGLYSTNNICYNFVIGRIRVSEFSAQVLHLQRFRFVLLGRGRMRRPSSPPSRLCDHRWSVGSTLPSLRPHPLHRSPLTSVFSWCSFSAEQNISITVKTWKFFSECKNKNKNCVLCSNLFENQLFSPLLTVCHCVHVPSPDRCHPC